MSTLEQDRKLIADLGGPSAVAKRLQYAKGGPQRVQNWLTRGIPPAVRLQHPDLFMAAGVLARSGDLSVAQGA